MAVRAVKNNGWDRRVGDYNRHGSLTLNLAVKKRRSNACPGYDSALIMGTKPQC
jgi:hypothetical protein